jgi:hypothetical protein
MSIGYAQCAATLKYAGILPIVFQHPGSSTMSPTRRPVQLIFDRCVNKTTPGRFRTRVITEGVIPNNTPDVGVGKTIKKLPALRQIGFQANRSLSTVHKTFSQLLDWPGNSSIGPCGAAEVDGQRASACDSAIDIQALFTVLVVSSFQLRGFTNSELQLAQLLAFDSANTSDGKLTCDLRRLRLHGIIERTLHGYRYQLTSEGLPIALFQGPCPDAPARTRGDRARRPARTAAEGSGLLPLDLSNSNCNFLGKGSSGRPYATSPPS